MNIQPFHPVSSQRLAPLPCLDYDFKESSNTCHISLRFVMEQKVSVDLCGYSNEGRIHLMFYKLRLLYDMLFIIKGPFTSCQHCPVHWTLWSEARTTALPHSKALSSSAQIPNYFGFLGFDLFDLFIKDLQNVSL